MKKISLALIILIIVGICIPAASAETIEGQIHDVGLQSEDIPAIDTGAGGDVQFSLWKIEYNPVMGLKPASMHFLDIQLSPLSQSAYAAYPNYHTYDLKLERHGTNIKVADVTVEFFKGDFVPSESDPSKGKTYGSMRLTFNNWDYEYLNSLTEKTSFYFSSVPSEYWDFQIIRNVGAAIPSDAPVLFYQIFEPYKNTQPASRVGHHVYFYELEYFTNNYTISTDEHGTDIYITRIFGDDINPSKIIVSKSDGTELYKSPDYETANRGYSFPYGDLIIDIEGVYGVKYRILGDTIIKPPDSTPASVTVYVKNSQTGALIADANVVIDALVNGEYYPVVNRTEPSGIFTITLQPTGGGQPNPDGYRLIVTADGYNNPMPEINFTVDDYKNYIHCLLDPIAGGPVNENKTFIDFFVRDMSSNPISGATVKFGKYTLITNSAGYTVFEVDKNNNYAWTISKSGYGALTGNAVIGDAPRHTINTVLAPAVTPTPQTPIPTGTVIGPTPTMTAPTGETVSNWLEWFAAHFGMILGGGAEIGKIFMWLCFAVPVGVYVGKEAKAGAAGFMAGAGIVTLFFALIGWVPIWLLVLLALIIGLLYAKVFNNPDNGGGR